MKKLLYRLLCRLRCWIRDKHDWIEITDTSHYGEMKGLYKKCKQCGSECGHVRVNTHPDKRYFKLDMKALKKTDGWIRIDLSHSVDCTGAVSTYPHIYAERFDAERIDAWLTGDYCEEKKGAVIERS